MHVAGGVLAEHWNVLQDKAKSEKSRSGRPTFGDHFPVGDAATRTRRRVVAGDRSRRSVVPSDQRRPAYIFEIAKGFERTCMSALEASLEVSLGGR